MIKTSALSSRKLISYLKKMVSQPVKQAIKNQVLYHRSLNREDLSHLYLKGQGIEIGALHQPLKVPKTTKVKYVDRMSRDDLRKHYPELANYHLLETDIIDNGETLVTIPNDSQDFVIANHFLEHSQDPIQTLFNIVRVLKTGGILYLALPDKRYTFDINRPVTPYQHLLDDYKNGCEHSKKQHFEEWVKYVEKIEDPKEAKVKTDQLLAQDYSIHFHVWTQTEMLEMFVQLRRMGLNVDVELCLKKDIEFIFILRKVSN